MASIGQIIKKYVLAPFGNKGTELPVNEIPLDMATIPNQMSWNQGIPLITAEPVRDDGTGGIPSRGGDHAGLHNVWSTNQYAAQFGIMPNEYDSRIQTDDLFGGYPRGAVVFYPARDANVGSKNIYISLIDNNKDLPTVTSSWTPLVKEVNTAPFMRFPNWAASYAQENPNYTFPQSGWFSLVYQASHYNRLYLNGQIVGWSYARGSDYGSVMCSMIPISAGDVLSGDGNLYGSRFCPLK